MPYLIILLTLFSMSAYGSCDSGTLANVIGVGSKILAEVSDNGFLNQSTPKCLTVNLGKPILLTRPQYLTVFKNELSSRKKAIAVHGVDSGEGFYFCINMEDCIDYNREIFMSETKGQKLRPVLKGKTSNIPENKWNEFKSNLHKSAEAKIVYRAVFDISKNLKLAVIGIESVSKNGVEEIYSLNIIRNNKFIPTKRPMVFNPIVLEPNVEKRVALVQNENVVFLILQHEAEDQVISIGKNGEVISDLSVSNGKVEAD